MLYCMKLILILGIIMLLSNSIFIHVCCQWQVTRPDKSLLYIISKTLEENVEKLEEMEISNNSIVMPLQHKRTSQEGKDDFSEVK